MYCWYLHTASAVVTRHSIDSLECAVAGRVGDFIAVRPSWIATHALGNVVLDVTHTVFVADDIGARGDW